MLNYKKNLCNNQIIFLNKYLFSQFFTSKKYVDLTSLKISCNFKVYFNTYTSMVKLSNNYSLFIGHKDLQNNSFVLVNILSCLKHPQFFLYFMYTYKNNMLNNYWLLLNNVIWESKVCFYVEPSNVNLCGQILNFKKLYRTDWWPNQSFYGIQQNNLFADKFYPYYKKQYSDKAQLRLNSYSIFEFEILKSKINFIMNKKNFLYNLKQICWVDVTLNWKPIFNIKYYHILHRYININYSSIFYSFKYCATEYSQFKVKIGRDLKLQYMLNDIWLFKPVKNFKIYQSELCVNNALWVLPKRNFNFNSILTHLTVYEWYGRILADHKTHMLHFNVYNYKNLREYWIRKTKIAIPDILWFATPMTNIVYSQTINSYFGEFFEKPSISQPFFNNMFKKTPLTRWVKTDPMVWESKNFVKYSTSNSWNYSFYMLFFDFMFRPTFLNLMRYKWHQKTCLDKKAILTNKWPYSFSFNIIRTKLTLYEMSWLHKQGIYDHFTENVKLARAWIRWFVYYPFFFWIHDYHYWLNRLDWYFFKNYIWSLWLHFRITQNVQSKHLLFLWFRVFKPYFLDYIDYGFQTFNVYWMASRYGMLSKLLDIIWKPGYLLYLSPYFFRFYGWHYDLSKFWRNIFHLFLSPLYYLYRYIGGAYWFYINFTYTIFCLYGWLIWDMFGKFNLYFFKCSFTIFKKLIFIFLKIINFNLSILIDSLVYTLFFFIYSPIFLWKALLHLKNIGGMFMFNCNFLLVITALKFIIRKLLIKYNVNEWILSKLSVYLFAWGHCIFTKILFSTNSIVMVLTAGSLIVTVPCIITYDYIIYNFFDFITSYTYSYFDNKLNLDGLKPIKLYVNTNSTHTLDSIPNNGAYSETPFNFTILGIAIVSICCVCIGILDFNNLYIPNNS